MLTPYHEPAFPTQPRNTRPPPVVEGKEDKYEVEEIVDSRKRGRNLEYKVKWKGYGPHEMTWEPLSNLNNAKEAIQDFHNRSPNKPNPPSLQHLKIPIHLFPKELLRPMPQTKTEPIPTNMPTEKMLSKLARNGVRALRGG